MKAFLVIDMQKGSFTEETPRFDTPGVVTRINRLAKSFRALNLPVVWIPHDGTGSGEFEKGKDDWQMLADLEVEEHDVRIDKTANDVFYRSELNDTLQRLGVNELVITGCATDFCVEATVQSALTKDYHITVVSDGHTTGERPHLSAKKTIEHYNWVWQNMLPTGGAIKVKNAEDVLGEGKVQGTNAVDR